MVQWQGVEVSKAMDLIFAFFLKEYQYIDKCKFLLALMGVLAPGSVYARPSAQPHIDTSGNFSAQVSAE
jgi:hypothetical protein